MKVIGLVLLVAFSLVNSSSAVSAVFPDYGPMKQSLLSVSKDEDYLIELYPLLLKNAGKKMSNVQAAEVFYVSCSVASAKSLVRPLSACLSRIPDWTKVLFKTSDADEMDEHLAFRYTLGADDLRRN